MERKIERGYQIESDSRYSYYASDFTADNTTRDEPYQQVRKQRGTRKGFFRDIETLTRYFLFESWQHLITFMLAELLPEGTLNTS